jgi:ribosomal-protein-alanine N-acetyltransferase
MTLADVDDVWALEVASYGFPWSRGNFTDSLVAGYQAELLRGADGGLVGYYLAMAAVDEMHLLNLCVSPAHRRQGHARLMLDALQAHCAAAGLRTLWLEVRESNAAARQLYQQHGFATAGLRRGYYPAGPGRREDAVVMMRAVAPAGPLAGVPRHALD